MIQFLFGKTFYVWWAIALLFFPCSWILAGLISIFVVRMSNGNPLAGSYLSWALAFALNTCALIGITIYTFYEMSMRAFIQQKMLLFNAGFILVLLVGLGLTLVFFRKSGSVNY